MAYFGEGHGPIHVDNVKCTGAERSLTDCIKQLIGSHNCRHSEDAGVICNYGQRDNGTRVKGEAIIRNYIDLYHKHIYYYYILLITINLINTFFINTG